MILNKRKSIVKEAINMLLLDLRTTGEYSNKTLDWLRELPNDILIDVIERFGHGHILEETSSSNNLEIVNKLQTGVNLDDISYINFKGNNYLVFKTGHIIERRGNELILKNYFEQSIIVTDLTSIGKDLDKVVNDYLSRISKLRSFKDIDYVKVLIKPLLAPNI